MKVLSTVFDELTIEETVCKSQRAAMEELVRGNSSAVVIDFDTPGAVEFAKMARLIVPLDHGPAIFAVIGKTDTGGQATQTGANVSLYKPLAIDDVRSAFNVRKKMTQSSKRSADRHKMRALVYLELETGDFPAIGMNVSQHGLAVQAADPVPMVSRMSFRFMLPKTPHTIKGRADVIWADAQGRAGMFFTELSPASRKHLKHWLSRQGASAKDQVRALLCPQRRDAVSRLE